MTHRFTLLAVATAALSLLGGCGGGDAEQENAAHLSQTESVSHRIGAPGSGGTVTPQVGGVGGSGIMLVGQATSCTSHLLVALVGASVNPSAAAQPGTAGWTGVATAAPVVLDLAALVAGDTLPLDFSKLPDGNYRQVRLMEKAVDDDEDGNSQGAQGGPSLAAAITVAQGRATGSIDLANVCTNAAGKARRAAGAG